VSRGLVDDLDETFEVAPDRCARCDESLDDAAETARVRRQVVDVEPPPPKVTEYPLVSRRCGGCGHVNDPAATDVARTVDPVDELVNLSLLLVVSAILFRARLFVEFIPLSVADVRLHS
jgi:hypothetical protein